MEYILRNIIIIFVTSTLIFSCKTEKIEFNSIKSIEVTTDTIDKIVIDSVTKEGVKPLKKQTIKRPDYIPPENGGVNEKWSNNRHKVLTRDSNCYFGKGLQKRHRYRGGRQNLE